MYQKSRKRREDDQRDFHRKYRDNKYITPFKLKNKITERIMVETYINACGMHCECMVNKACMVNKLLLITTFIYMSKIVFLKECYFK